MFRSSITAKHLVIVVLLLLPSYAFAYIDPGSGLLLWQLLGSLFIGLLFYVKRFISFVKKLIHKNDRS